MEKQKPVPADNEEQASAPGAALIFASGLLFLIVQFLPSPLLWPAFSALFLFAVAVLLRDRPVVHATLFMALVVLGPLLHPLFRSWPFRLLIPTAAYFAVSIVVPWLRPGLAWLRPGRLNFQVVCAVIAISAVSAGALLAWYVLFRPDLSVHLAHIPSIPVWLLPFAGLGFACGNAALEELAFRGILMQAYESAVNSWIALCCQAILFAGMHFQAGFPNRASGLVMTFVYGSMLGALRRQSRGLLAPWLAHIAADMTIFIILVTQL